MWKSHAFTMLVQIKLVQVASWLDNATTSDIRVRSSLKKWLYWLKTLSSPVCNSLWLTLVSFVPSKLAVWNL